MNIGFIGLGKLGLPFAEAVAEHHPVQGYDMARRQSSQIDVVDSLRQAVEGKDLVFVVLPTPHHPDYDGSHPTHHLSARDFGYEDLVTCIRDVADIATAEQVICSVSTVLPGTIRREIAPVLGRTNLLYTPSFMAMGAVREDFHAPEFFLAGSRSGQEAEFETLCDFYTSCVPGAKMVTGTWEEAESIKVFYNTFISFKLSLVNLAQDVAMKIGHIDVDRVTEALGQATRRIVSPQYLRAGMGDGGPCHPRDNVALRYLAQELDLGYDLFGAICESRDMQARNLARFLVAQGKPVLITHKAFKPGTPHMDGSYSLLVGHFVQQEGIKLDFLEDLEHMPVEARTVLLSHDVEYSGAPFPAGSTVVDPWRRFTSENLEVIHYGNTRGVGIDKLTS